MVSILLSDGPQCLSDSISWIFVILNIFLTLIVIVEEYRCSIGGQNSYNKTNDEKKSEERELSYFSGFRNYAGNQENNDKLRRIQSSDFYYLYNIKIYANMN